MLHLALFFLSASSLVCKTYIGLNNQIEIPQLCEGADDHCMKIIWADGFEAFCAQADECPSMKTYYEDKHGELKDWECSVCDTENCNAIDESRRTVAVTTKEVSTSSKPSDDNGSATSKSFHVAGDNGLCSQWNFDQYCTKAQLLASSLKDKDKLTIGECPAEFEKACDGKFRSKTGSSEFGSPMTISAAETNGCGEAEFVWLTDDCDTCSIMAGVFGYKSEVVEKPTCRDKGSEGFIKDFINNVKDGEPLYLGIVAVAVLVPILCCLCCCCCAANPGGRGKVTYVASRV